jgi:hypothetical protein
MSSKVSDPLLLKAERGKRREDEERGGDGRGEERERGGREGDGRGEERRGGEERERRERRGEGQTGCHP